MSLSLSSIATALTTAAAVAQSTETLYQYGAKLIDAAETAYANAVNAGESKKAAVLAVLKVAADAIGEDWEAIKESLSSWIDLVVSAWNAAKELFTKDEESAEESTEEATEATAVA